MKITISLRTSLRRLSFRSCWSANKRRLSFRSCYVVGRSYPSHLALFENNAFVFDHLCRQHVIEFVPQLEMNIGIKFSAKHTKKNKNKRKHIFYYYVLVGQSNLRNHVTNTSCRDKLTTYDMIISSFYSIPYLSQTMIKSKRFPKSKYMHAYFNYNKIINSELVDYWSWSLDQ